MSHSAAVTLVLTLVSISGALGWSDYRHRVIGWQTSLIGSVAFGACSICWFFWQ